MGEGQSKVQPIPMVRASSAILCVRFLEEIGAPAERLLEDAGISPGTVEYPERLLTLHQTLRFLGQAAGTQGLPEFGLQAALATPFAELGAYAQLIRGALTVRAALHRLISAFGLYDSGARLWLDLDADGGTARFCHAYAPAHLPSKEQGGLFAVAMMIQAIRVMVGRATWRPDAVVLCDKDAPFGSHCEALLGVPVHCAGGQHRAIVFARALLAERPMPCRPSPNGFDDGYEFLRATAPAEDFAGSVLQTIETLLCDGYPDIRNTAEAVGLSARTLQRRLAEAGESYHHLVDSVRLGAGIRLLTDGDARLVDVAAELGYADQANFTRAFRRLTGMSPRAFQRAQRSPPGVSP
jgi:AraC-like DNA-binding protein